MLTASYNICVTKTLRENYAKRVDMGKSQAFWAGVRAELPILLGTIPFGLIYGILALEAGLSPWMAYAMSFIVFAGSAQFLIIQMVAATTPILIMLLSVTLINLRHVLYSASIADYMQHLSTRWKWGMAYLLTDEAYVVSIAHYLDQDEPVAQKHWYYIGTGITLWLSWQLATASGILLAAQIPTAWSLDFAVPLTFIALTFPAIKDRPALAAALTAGTVAVLCHALPFKLGLIIGSLVGIAVGTTLERISGP